VQARRYSSASTSISTRLGVSAKSSPYKGMAVAALQRADSPCLPIPPAPCPAMAEGSWPAGGSVVRDPVEREAVGARG
jgi:hypothetical protein